MTFSEALKVLGEIAEGKYHSLKVEATVSSSGAPLEVFWACYVSGAGGWGMSAPTPELALQAMREKLKPTTAKDLDAAAAPGAEPSPRAPRRLELEDA